MLRQCLSKRGNVMIRGKMFTANDGVFDISKGCFAKFIEAKHHSYGYSVHGGKLYLCPLFFASHQENLTPYSEALRSISRQKYQYTIRTQGRGNNFITIFNFLLFIFYIILEENLYNCAGNLQSDLVEYFKHNNTALSVLH